MATLKELCEQNELPFKVSQDTWATGQWFEAKEFNSLDVIGFNSEGYGMCYPLNSTKFWHLYTEPKPKKILKPYLIKTNIFTYIIYEENEETAKTKTENYVSGMNFIGPAHGLPEIEIEVE